MMILLDGVYLYAESDLLPRIQQKQLKIVCYLAVSAVIIIIIFVILCTLRGVSFSVLSVLSCFCLYCSVLLYATSQGE